MDPCSVLQVYHHLRNRKAAVTLLTAKGSLTWRCHFCLGHRDSPTSRVERQTSSLYRESSVDTFNPSHMLVNSGDWLPTPSLEMCTVGHLFWLLATTSVSLNLCFYSSLEWQFQASLNRILTNENVSLLEITYPSTVEQVQPKEREIG